MGQKESRKRPPPPPEAEYVSVDASAVLSGLSRETLYRHAREGRLPLHKVGRRTLVKRTDLIALVEGSGARAAGG
jgi:excisionase family DNA binding protein